MNKDTKITLGVTIGTLVVSGILLYVFRDKIFGSSVAKKAAKKAEKEWQYWNRDGRIKEGDGRTMQRLRDYWIKGAGVSDWSDRKMVNEAWSAAFISYIMRESGAKDNFKYSTSHSKYIVDSISNKKNNTKGFKGYKPSEVKLAVGDLVCYPRQSGVGYDTTNRYASHCDIVVAIKGNEAVTIGGNVSNSVTKTSVLLNNGKIDKSRDEKGYGGYFVVIKNN